MTAATVAPTRPLRAMWAWFRGAARILRRWLRRFLTVQWRLVHDVQPEVLAYWEKRRSPWIAWIFIIALAILGATLIILAGFVKEGLLSANFWHDELIELVLSHIGVALFVGAIGGVGYEWFAHHHRLQEQIDSMFAINRRIADQQLNPVLEVLISDRSDDQGVHAELRKHIDATVRAIATIDRSVASDLISLRFISTLMRYADNAARALASADREEGEHVLVLPPTSAELADEILAAHVSAMRPSDRYDVLSDFSTWNGQRLSKFRHALSTAVRNGQASVRRVFSFFPHDARLTRAEAISVLREHWCLAETVFAETGNAAYNVGLSFLEPREHVGVFRLRYSTTCFKPQGNGTLERLSISWWADREILDIEDHWTTALKYSDATRQMTFAEFMSRDDVMMFLGNFAGPWPTRLADVCECQCIRQLGATRSARVEAGTTPTV